MAQLLVKAVDSPTLTDHPEGAYRAGDVVFVAEDDHLWGAEEQPPKFYVVQMPGVDVADVQHLLEMQQIDDPAQQNQDPNLPARKLTIQRRATQFDLSQLTDQQKLDAGGNRQPILLSADQLADPTTLQRDVTVTDPAVVSARTGIAVDLVPVIAVPTLPTIRITPVVIAEPPIQVAPGGLNVKG